MRRGEKNKMGYLQSEIEEELLGNSIEAMHFTGLELEGFLNYIRKTFYGGDRGLDPNCLSEAGSFYDANFWRKIIDQKEDFVYLMVFDGGWHVWRFESSGDLQLILGQTTGYVFWLLDSTKKTLVYCGDSDEVVWSRRPRKP